MQPSPTDERFRDLMKGPYGRAHDKKREGTLMKIFSIFEKDGHPHGWKTFSQILTLAEESGLNKRTLIRYLKDYPDTCKFFNRKESGKNTWYRISTDYTEPSDFMMPSALLEKAYSQQLLLIPQSGDGGECFFVNLFNFPYLQDLDADAWATLEKHLDVFQRAYDNLQRSIDTYAMRYAQDHGERFILHWIKSDRGPVPPKLTMTKMVEGLEKYVYQKPVILLSSLSIHRLDFIVRYGMKAALEIFVKKMSLKGYTTDDTEEMEAYIRKDLKVDMVADNHLRQIHLEEFRNLWEQKEENLRQREAESERLNQMLQSKSEDVVESIRKGVLANYFKEEEFEQRGSEYVEEFIEKWYYHDEFKDGVKFLEKMCGELANAKDISKFLSKVREGHTKGSEFASLRYGFKPFDTKAYHEFTETIRKLWTGSDKLPSKGSPIDRLSWSSRPIMGAGGTQTKKKHIPIITRPR